MSNINISNEKEGHYQSDNSGFAASRLCKLLNKIPCDSKDMVKIQIKESATFIDERIVLGVKNAFKGQSVKVKFDGGIEGTKPLLITINGGQLDKTYIIGNQGVSGLNMDIARPLRLKVFKSLLNNFPHINFASFDEDAAILRTPEARNIALTYGTPNISVEEISACPSCSSKFYTELTSGEGNAISGFLDSSHKVYRYCNQCSLVFLAFQVEKSNLSIFYTNDSYDRSLSEADYLSHWKMLSEETTSHWGNYIRGLEEIKNGNTILDLGCGAGDFAYLARKKCPDSKIYALDWHLTNSLNSSLKSIGVATYNAALDGQGFQMFERQSIDIVTLWEVVEHLKIDDLKPLLKSIHNLLTSTGQLIISTPDFFDEHCRSLDFWAMAPGEHLSVFCVESLGAILAECGFEICRIERESVMIKSPGRWFDYGQRTNQTIAGRGNAAMIENLLKDQEFRENFKEKSRLNKIGSELILFAKKR